jgi:teichuronic acid biosynthesis glycosyltransferase TuaG
MTPGVSIVMPAYNAGKFIKASIRSVQDQTFQDWELIVVDDGSTDNTAAIIRELQVYDQRIKYIYQKNKMPAGARNTGIRNATGEWVAFLDSDDLWIDTKLEKQVHVLRETNVDVLFTDGYILDESDQQLRPYDSLVGRFTGAELFKILFRHNRIPVLSVLLKTSLAKRIEFDESPNVYGCEDWDYWLRCCKDGAEFVGLNDRTFKYRLHTTGVSSNILNMHMSGFNVLFKNYDIALFNEDEKKVIDNYLVEELRFIISGLYEKNDTSKISYYLTCLKQFSNDKIKYDLSLIFVKLFKGRSRRFVNLVIYS